MSSGCPWQGRHIVRTPLGQLVAVTPLGSRKGHVFPLVFQGQRQGHGS